MIRTGLTDTVVASVPSGTDTSFDRTDGIATAKGRTDIDCPHETLELRPKAKQKTYVCGPRQKNGLNLNRLQSTHITTDAIH